ncbi:MAG: Smr/MutS family protein [Rhizobacter sp.]|nr:Smr/MutS family protein [Rhizobacter sp.]
MSSRGLHTLSELKAALDRARREAERQDALQREIAAREKRERELFAITVGPVQPVRPTGRARQARALPTPEPRQRQRDEREALRESLSDEFNVDTLLETDETLSFRRPEIGLDVVRKLRRGGWAIQAQLDLHGLRRDPARVKLNAFIRDAAEQGLRCVRVVHGKGLGSPGREPVLKARVRSWLVQKNEVLAFVQARPAEGGSGALVVLLKAS